MKGKGTIDRTLVTGSIIAIAGVVAILLISIWQSRRLQDTQGIVRHTNQVIYNTQDALIFNLRYEQSVKNFLLTGERSFLDSLPTLASLLHQRLDSVRGLTIDNPVQQGRIVKVIQSVDKNIDLLDQSIRLSKGDDLVGSGRLIDASASFGYSHQIQQLANDIKEEETRLLNQRRQTNQRRASELQYVLWGLIAAVAVLAFIVVKKMRIDLAREKVIKDQLSLFNKTLEERVLLQTSALQTSEEKYKTLFYKSPLPKWIYDLDSLQFLEVNEAAIRHYGYSQDEFHAMSIMDIRPEEDIPCLITDVDMIRGSSDTAGENSWRHLKKNGDVISVDLTAHAIDYEGRSARMVIVNDITERKKSDLLMRQLNLDLQKRAMELAASNAELERFAYIASHDLQEPLRMVSSFLQLLKKKYNGVLDEKATQYIHFAVDGSERMKALILDLLEYSRVGTGRESFTYVDMGMVIKEVADIFREKIIVSRAQLDLEPLPVVFGDRVQLTQLIQNLVSNALKYHGAEPPVIRIAASPLERGKGWQFCVADNGIGIDPMFFEKIFIIFQRLHNKSDYSGTGIGLAICKKIVERHGGRVWVESDPGKGSSFFFTIISQP